MWYWRCRNKTTRLGGGGGVGMGWSRVSRLRSQLNPEERQAEEMETESLKNLNLIDRMLPSKVYLLA